jgi:hypothetical protein
MFGRLRAYRVQNSTTTSFVKMSLLLAHRLMNRGFSTQTLARLFREAGNRALTLPAAGSTAYARHPDPSNRETAMVSAPPTGFSPEIPP